MLVQRSVRKFFVVSISALAWFSAPAYAQTNYYYTAPVADFPTTSATFTPVTGCSLSFTPGSTLENWVVMATGQVRSSSTSDPQAAHVRMRVQSTVEAEAGVQNSPANGETGFFLMHRITGTTASQTIDVQAQDPFATSPPRRSSNAPSLPFSFRPRPISSGPKSMESAETAWILPIPQF